MRIREVSPAEGDAVRRLVTEAFLTAEHADGTEGELVGRLRATPDFLPGYEIVGEDRGTLIGHAMMTRGVVPTGDGDLSVLVLAPVSVALSHRRKGVGKALVETFSSTDGETVGPEPSFWATPPTTVASGLSKPRGSGGPFLLTCRPNTHSRRSG